VWWLPPRSGSTQLLLDGDRGDRAPQGGRCGGNLLARSAEPVGYPEDQPYAFGNRILPEVPARALRAGRFQRVPVLAGATRDEHRLFVGLFRILAGQPVTAAQYPQLLAEAFGQYAGRVQDRYPLAAYSSPSLAWATALTDRMWARSTVTSTDCSLDTRRSTPMSSATARPRCTCRSRPTSRPAPSTPPSTNSTSGPSFPGRG
jgi:hypothetical protein